MYFSFGQSHRHELGGVVLDKDVLLKVTAEDPPKVMFDTFGEVWSMGYSEAAAMKAIEFFPRGIVEIHGLGRKEGGEA
jgi:hypothetical protein